jgi:hypothetical protein
VKNDRKFPDFEGSYVVQSHPFGKGSYEQGNAL